MSRTRRAPARSAGVRPAGGVASRASAHRSTTASAPGASRSSRDPRAHAGEHQLGRARRAGSRRRLEPVAASDVGQGGAPAVQPGLGVAEDGVGPLPVGAVVVREQGHPDGHGVRPVRHQAAHEHQVPQRLGHLLAVVADHPGVDVHPGERAGRGVPGRSAGSPAPRQQRDPGVRGAHLVVREYQVRAAGLDVEGVTEVLGGDRRALDVPAGPAAAERAIPRLARRAAPPARPGRRAGPSCRDGPDRRRAPRRSRPSRPGHSRWACPARRASRTPGPPTGRSRRPRPRCTGRPGRPSGR